MNGNQKAALYQAQRTTINVAAELAKGVVDHPEMPSTVPLYVRERVLRAVTNADEHCRQLAHKLKEASEGIGHVVMDLDAVERLIAAGDALRAELNPPDKNCSCHISPPCNNCVEFESQRMAISDWDEAKAALL